MPNDTANLRRLGFIEIAPGHWMKANDSAPLNPPRDPVDDPIFAMFGITPEEGRLPMRRSRDDDDDVEVSAEPEFRSPAEHARAK